MLKHKLALALLLTATTAQALAGTELIDAIRRGDIDAVSRLIDDADVNATEADGTTALHWAAHRNDPALAEMLLKAEAEVNVANEYGVTPLWLACTNQGDTLVKMLLTAGADPDARLWTGESVLMNCARTGAGEAVAALIASGADLEASEKKNQQTALMWAAGEGHGAVTRLLVDSGAKIHGRSAGGFTPLMYAARSGDVESARVLLEAGADIEATVPKYGTALVIAAAGGHEDLSLYLVEQGARTDITDEYGISALHYAMAAGLAALNGVRYDPVYRAVPPNMHRLAAALLDRGADPNLQIKKSRRLGPDGSPFDMEGTTPFLLAAIAADVDMMRLLRDRGADVHITGKGGTTALMAAARAACTGSCAFAGGNVNISQADMARSLRAVEAAVEMGVEVNARNEDGQTAMHMAAFTGVDPVVKYLADNGADVNVRSNYGETPWSMASGISPVLRYRGLYGVHESTAALLISLGATTTTREEMDDDAPPPPGQ